MVNAQDPSCFRFYTVVAGDTCDGIAAKENVPSYQLASENSGIINAGCTNLFPGEVSKLQKRFQPLCLRSPLQVLCLASILDPGCHVTHVVAAGDTCLSIAAAADTTVDTLLENNPNVNSQCSNIYPGEVRSPGLRCFAMLVLTAAGLHRYCALLTSLCTRRRAPKQDVS